MNKLCFPLSNFPYQCESPFAPDVSRVLTGWTDSAVDFNVWVEFLGETLQVAEPHVFAGELAQALVDSCFLCSTLCHSEDALGP